MVFKIKRAFLVLMLIVCIFMTVDTAHAATRKKISNKAAKKDTQEAVVQKSSVAEPVIEIVKAEPKKKDISEMGLRKLQKMEALASMSSDRIIYFTVAEYK